MLGAIAGDIIGAYSNASGHAFQYEAGRGFRFEAGHPWLLLQVLLDDVS